MQKQFVTSTIVKGIIEEVNIQKIVPSSYRFHETLSDFEENNDEICELAISIRQIGLLNPIMVRTVEAGFKIVAGNRRYLACKKLGLRKILCQIVELEEREAFEISLVENLQRKNLDPLEEGKAFKAYVFDYGWGGLSDLSSKVSKSVSYISKRISLLELPQEILDEIKKTNMAISMAEELIFIKGKDKQLEIAKELLAKKLPINRARILIKRIKKNEEPTSHSDIYEEIIFDKKDTLEEIDMEAQRAFDKTISTLKIALTKIGGIVGDVEDNWIVYEMLMQHKNMLNDQINVLIKEKKKLY